MNRINKLFSKKQRNLLSVYFTAGYPALNSTVKIITALEKKGADMIEIGIPFSDPVADGEVIQASNSIALKNGMSLNTLFKQLKNIRETVSLPLVLMGYFNPVYRMGMKPFLQKCSEIGIDGVIIPDLPVETYIEQFEPLFKEYNIHFICLITPQSHQDRIRFIDRISGGFIYLVSSASTTGTRNSFNDEQTGYFQRVKNMELKNPCLVGFGISNRPSFNKACAYANGAIIGSAFIKALGKPGEIEDIAEDFVYEFINPIAV